jgi:hypothetical protein
MMGVIGRAHHTSTVKVHSTQTNGVGVVRCNAFASAGTREPDPSALNLAFGAIPSQSLPVKSMRDLATAAQVPSWDQGA